MRDERTPKDVCGEAIRLWARLRPQRYQISRLYVVKSSLISDKSRLPVCSMSRVFKNSMERSMSERVYIYIVVEIYLRRQKPMERSAFSF